jgi:hypothetical protein
MKDLRTVRSANIARFSTSRLDRSVVLFGGTLFLSAFLLLAVQPMIAKMLLPLLGGAAAVWTTSQLLFQTLLLLGYAYAHATLVTMGRRPQVLVQIALVLLPILVLPIQLPGSTPPSSGSPVPWLLIALVTSIGLPFFVLATSTAVLQKWYSTTNSEGARDPYFLYAASNLGSLAALLAYPTVVEPTLGLPQQTWWWTSGYVMFAGLVCWCAVATLRSGAANHPVDASAEPVEALPWRRSARWTLLAFIPSSLLLGVTTHISTDIAAVPLLWVVPLALYLATFVVAFSPSSQRVVAIAGRLMPILVVPLAMFLVGRFNQPVLMVLPFHLLTCATVAMVCHGELAADRPSRSHLTAFYLWMAAGGALGGLFNAVVAPALFPGVAEYPLVLALSCLVVPAALTQGRREKGKGQALMVVMLPAIVFSLSAASVLVINRVGLQARWPIVGAALAAVIAFSQRRSPVRLAACVAALLASALLVEEPFGRVTRTFRTFFGVYRLVVDERFHHRVVVHGTTVHGMQSALADRRLEPLSYYHRTGPIGQVFAHVPAASSAEIAVAGLGAGSLASYRRPDQHWTFYELDPIVEQIARDPNWFTYLSDCGSQCSVVIGDARLMLGRTRPGQFGVIVIDTFSSDAIPVHLLTRDAIELYLSRLAPGGVIVLHLSNLHLAVDRVAARIAHDVGLAARWQPEPSDAGSLKDGKLPSAWMVLARQREDFGPLLEDARWRIPAVSRDAPVWTDDFSNILSVLRR